MPILKNWKPFLDQPHGKHIHLSGQVYGDERFADGTEIVTSRIVSMTENQAVTKKGVVYELQPMHLRGDKDAE